MKSVSTVASLRVLPPSPGGSGWCGRVLLRLLLRRSDVISGGVFSGYKDHVSPLPPSLFLRSCRGVLGHFAKMGFGDLKSASGLKVLNDFLSNRSYIEGWVRLFPRCGPARSRLQLPAAPPSWRAVSWYHGAFWITVRRNEPREAAAIDEELMAHRGSPSPWVRNTPGSMRATLFSSLSTGLVVVLRIGSALLDFVQMWAALLLNQRLSIQPCLFSRVPMQEDSSEGHLSLFQSPLFLNYLVTPECEWLYPSTFI